TTKTTNNNNMEYNSEIDVIYSLFEKYGLQDMLDKIKYYLDKHNQEMKLFDKDISFDNSFGVLTLYHKSILISKLNEHKQLGDNIENILKIKSNILPKPKIKVGVPVSEKSSRINTRIILMLVGKINNKMNVK